MDKFYVVDINAILNNEFPRRGCDTEQTTASFLKLIDSIESFVDAANADKDFISKAIDNYEHLPSLYEIYLIPLRGNKIILSLEPSEILRINSIISAYYNLIDKVNKALENRIDSILKDIEGTAITKNNKYKEVLASIPTNILKEELKFRDK